MTADEARQEVADLEKMLASERALYAEPDQDEEFRRAVARSILRLEDAVRAAEARLREALSK